MAEFLEDYTIINPIPTGLWNDVEHWGGPYLAPGNVGSLNL